MRPLNPGSPPHAPAEAPADDWGPTPFETGHTWQVDSVAAGWDRGAAFASVGDCWSQLGTGVVPWSDWEDTPGYVVTTAVLETSQGQVGVPMMLPRDSHLYREGTEVLADRTSAVEQEQQTAGFFYMAHRSLFEALRAVAERDPVWAVPSAAGEPAPRSGWEHAAPRAADGAGSFDPRFDGPRSAHGPRSA